MGLFTTLLKHLGALLGVVVRTPDEVGIMGGLRECAKGVRQINRALKSANTVGEKQQLIAALANIKSFRRRFKLIRKQGAGFQKETASSRVSWDDLKISAFNSRINTGVITNIKHKDPQKFLADCKVLFRRRIQTALKTNEAIKINTAFCGEFEIKTANKLLQEFKYFTTSNAPIYRDTDLNQWFKDKVEDPILKELSEFQMRDSGWSLTGIVNLGVNINKFTPQLGSSYIELPEQIKRKEACINVRNTDERCFSWAILSALYPADKDPQRTSKYPDPSTALNLAGIQFPMTIRQVPRFEKQNQVSVNIYTLKKNGKKFITLPTYLTKDKKEKHVNLLLIQDTYTTEEDNLCPVKYHYVWIKNLSRLVSFQLSKKNGRKYFCDRCLHYFRSQDRLDKHVVDCVKMNECRIRLPTDEQKNINFKNYKNKDKVPFIIYADLECILKSVEKKNMYQEHVPSSIGYYVKCSYDPSLSFYRSYRGEDCISWFVKELDQFAEDLEPVLLCPYDMTPLTFKQQVDFDRATHCLICEQPFTSEDKKVRDHFHLSPENNYRGPAHESCNINYKDSHVVPIAFHNLSGYDAHFLIKKIATLIEGHVDLLPITNEKYISFTKNIAENLIKFRFIDSFRFMTASLDTLASHLNTFPNLKSQFNDIPEEKFALLTKKGVYPYDFMDSPEKFEYTSLPEQKHFYNKLNDCNIDNKHYEHAHNVWRQFQIQNLGEYSDLYMKTDILLLADVFEEFRGSCHRTYGLDPAHYYTLPGYSWDVALKTTGVTLELFTDIDMLMFIERGIRGGLSQCSKRRAHANNKYMTNYDSSISDSYLMYYDVNNQYGYAMCQRLPTGSFKWVDNFNSFDVTNISDESDTGYILEVDLEYPEYLHDKHKDLPFCPEHLTPPSSKQYKLMTTLYNKTRYVIHYRNLKQALSNGLILKEIHRILSFKQSAWLKTYIDLNTDLRKASKNEFERNLYKLMNNAVFGKTMENIRNHRNIKLINKWEGRYGAEALISKPEFKYVTVFDEHLVAVELNKNEIFFNKPIYVGMSILDISKTTIYSFHYNYMKEKFMDHCSVMYTDTDSLIYEIRDRDVYEVMQRDCHQHFDTSDYSPDNRFGIPLVNKKVLGMMKDENNGVIMTDFVGLRSKLYAVRLQEKKEDIKKAKGVKKSVLKSRITFNDYIECLDNWVEKNVNQNLIKSEKHQVHSITQTKIALNPHDDKRHLIPGSYETLPWGHYSIMDI